MVEPVMRVLVVRMVKQERAMAVILGDLAVQTAVRVVTREETRLGREGASGGMVSWVVESGVVESGVVESGVVESGVVEL